MYTCSHNIQLKFKFLNFSGEYAVTYLFTRYKFDWYEVEYSYFAAFKMMTIFFGNKLLSIIIIQENNSR